jgi:alkanesulfonate monooxygenase SsuD/methylene tetrahydromethanopterin reductase-like flavin-dependent oxidoreductase (luciferase family)
MLFGFSIPPVGPAHRSDAENYARVVEDCRLGQELGYDSAWSLEHHFTPYYPTPDTMLFLAHVAAHCPGLGLGTCVIVLPWAHPLRVTEQIAMLNALTTGTLYIGLGRGTARYEFDRLGVDMTQTREMFREELEIVKLGLYRDSFEYNGKHYKIPHTQIRPRPRDPAAIKLMGAIGSPQSAEIMAELGLPLLHSAQFPDRVTAEVVRRWKERTRSLGKPTENQGFALHSNPCIVAESDKEARALAVKHLSLFTRVQMEHYETEADYWKNVPGYEQFSKMFANLKKLSQPGPDLDAHIEQQLVGTPDTVIRRIEEIRDKLDITHFITGHFQYEMDDETRRRSLRLFGEHVIPHFRGKQASGNARRAAGR